MLSVPSQVLGDPKKRGVYDTWAKELQFRYVRTASFGQARALVYSTAPPSPPCSSSFVLHAVPRGHLRRPVDAPPCSSLHAPDASSHGILSASFRPAIMLEHTPPPATTRAALAPRTLARP